MRERGANLQASTWALRLALVGTILGATPLPGAPQVASLRSDEIRAVRGTIIKGTLASVSDGDTIAVALERGAPVRVRLEGIDCPEPGQPYSRAAATFTRRLLGSHALSVRVLDIDRYGRLVGRVTIEARDASLELVKAGLAWHYTEYSADRLLEAAEKEARGQRRGLWADPNPVPPWVARRPAVSTPERAQLASGQAPFHANTRSGVYHGDRCKNARCQNCTLTFSTQKEAEDAGFRPAGDCLRWVR